MISNFNPKVIIEIDSRRTIGKYFFFIIQQKNEAFVYGSALQARVK